jgi:2-polyprenyl-6-methoxyphenol hydroxylase-like FAD-dependent oxidoreductase
MSIRVRGSSVAAWCSVHLLTKAGFLPALERTARPRLPAIMLSEAALALIRDVFERPDLFNGAHRITRRVVRWGRDAEPMAFDHAAVVVSEGELLSELEQGLEPLEQRVDGDGDFSIFASRPLPAGPVEHCFGSRTAYAASVRLKDAGDSGSCWIESLEDGWLFLIPNAADSGWLLSVGCSPQTIPERSRLIAGRIASMSEPSGEFSASPRIVSPLSGPKWLACGTAGMAFDPICGDGTAHAVREAILAAAVVKAISTGGDATGLLRHYEARLMAGFQRHLATSLDFYRSGYGGLWWDQEVALLQQGLGWCAGKLSGYGRFRYQLNGFELRSIDNLPA